MSQMMSKVDFLYMNSNKGSKIESRLTAKTPNRNTEVFFRNNFQRRVWLVGITMVLKSNVIYFLPSSTVVVYMSGTLKLCDFDHQIRSLKIYFQIEVRIVISSWGSLIHWLFEENLCNCCYNLPRLVKSLKKH